jgi:hypothetical protein
MIVSRALEFCQVLDTGGGHCACGRASDCFHCRARNRLSLGSVITDVRGVLLSLDRLRLILATSHTRRWYPLLPTQTRGAAKIRQGSLVAAATG